MDLTTSWLWPERSLQELCEPEHYIPMKHSSYASQLKKYDHHKKRFGPPLFTPPDHDPPLPTVRESPCLGLSAI